MSTVEAPLTTITGSAFVREIEARSGEKVSTCFQCQKCSNGCPATFAMDVPPHKLIHMVQLGLKQQVLAANTSWVCACCQTCTARCPNSIDISSVMDSVRQLSEAANARPDLANTTKFHSAFLSSVRSHGNVFELGMMASYKLRTGDLFSDMGLAAKLLRKGKLKLFPRKFRASGPVKDIFRKAEECSKK